MTKNKACKMSKEERMKEDCVQYTNDVSLLQNLRKLPLSDKMTYDLDNVLDTLLRVLISLQRKIRDNDISCWAEMSIARHQLRCKVKRIEKQVQTTLQRPDEKKQVHTLTLPKLSI